MMNKISRLAFGESTREFFNNKPFDFIMDDEGEIFNKMCFVHINEVQNFFSSELYEQKILWVLILKSKDQIYNTLSYGSSDVLFEDDSSECIINTMNSVLNKEQKKFNFVNLSVYEEKEFLRRFEYDYELCSDLIGDFISELNDRFVSICESWQNKDREALLIHLHSVRNIGSHSGMAKLLYASFFLETQVEKEIYSENSFEFWKKRCEEIFQRNFDIQEKGCKNTF